VKNAHFIAHLAATAISLHAQHAHATCYTASRLPRTHARRRLAPHRLRRAAAPAPLLPRYMPAPQHNATCLRTSATPLSACACRDTATCRTSPRRATSPACYKWRHQAKKAACGVNNGIVSAAENKRGENVASLA